MSTLADVRDNTRFLEIPTGTGRYFSGWNSAHSALSTFSALPVHYALSTIVVCLRAKLEVHTLSLLGGKSEWAEFLPGKAELGRISQILDNGPNTSLIQPDPFEIYMEQEFR